MEKYIFILFIMLLIVLIVVVYFGYSKLNHISINVNRNTKNISAIQSLLGNHPIIANNMPLDPSMIEDSDDELENNFRNQEFNDLENAILRKKKNISEEENIIGDDDEDVEYIGDENENDGDDDDDNEVTEEIDTTGENNVEPEIEVEEDDQENDNKEENKEEDSEKESNEQEETDNDKKYKDIMERIDDMKTIEIESAKKKKSTPSKSPKNYDIGFTQISENDGKKYEIVANKNGVKRWKLVKGG